MNREPSDFGHIYRYGSGCQGNGIGKSCAGHIAFQMTVKFNNLRIDQLLHSIYNYGVDRVLNVMLLQSLDKKTELALQLLEPTNPTRSKYLEFISANISPDVQIPGEGMLKGLLRRILR